MTLYTRILVNLPDKPSSAARRSAPWRIISTSTSLLLGGLLLLAPNAL